MASEDKITVSIDAAIVARARAEFGVSGASDTAIVEDALNALFLDRLLDTTQSRSDLTLDEAERLARSEIQAARRERRPA